MKMETVQNLSRRNDGIDMLRLLTMFLVVVLHVLLRGGILNNCTPLTARYEAAWLLEVCAYCAVDCFALISGYVMVDKKFFYHRILSLWIQVVFYSVGITLLFLLFAPGTVNVKDLIKSFFPILTGQYWYFTAYFALFFFIPFLNAILNLLDHRQLRILMLTIFVILSVITTVRHKDIFDTEYGQNMLWLGALYLIGGYCKRFSVGKNLKKTSSMLLYFGMVFLSWAVKWGIEAFSLRITGTMEDGHYFVFYTSPTILLAAVALLVLFSNLQVRSVWLKTLVRTFGPLSFSVYIIHTQTEIWNHWIDDRFTGYLQYSVPGMLLAALGTAAGILCICLVIDFFRKKLFNLLQVDKHCRRAVEVCARLMVRAAKALGISD